MSSADWLQSAEAVRYPPEPWHLTGTMHVSLWRIRASELPPSPIPSLHRPKSLLGHAIIGTGWADYDSHGILSYNELLSAVLVDFAPGPSVTITNIWVDHPSSLAGGRELWSIPKQQASFERKEAKVSAVDDCGRMIAGFRYKSRLKLPGRWPLRVRTIQPSLGSGAAAPPTFATGKIVASIDYGSASWAFAPDGPLTFLQGRSPWFSLRLTDLTMEFQRER